MKANEVIKSEFKLTETFPHQTHSADVFKIRKRANIVIFLILKAIRKMTC